MANKDSINFNVLDSISVIANKLADSRLRIRRTQEFSKAQERLDTYFKTTSDATWMLCGIISYYFDNEGDGCNFNKLANFFCVPVMKVVSYTSDIESLLKKRLYNKHCGAGWRDNGTEIIQPQSIKKKTLFYVKWWPNRQHGQKNHHGRNYYR